MPLTTVQRSLCFECHTFVPLVSNLHRIITELDNPAAGEPRFSATRFGYAANGSAVAYMLGETWNVDGFDGGTLNQCVDSYTVTYAREFRYDSARQRYLNRELDPVALQIDGQYNELTAVWSDYVGDNVYSDYSVNRLAQSPSIADVSDAG